MRTSVIICAAPPFDLPTLWLDVYVCVSGCNCVSMILFWVFVFCISVDVYCACVRVRVRVRTTQICSYEGLHPPPTSHPLVSAEGLEPASLLLCLPGRRIFWSIIFHDCYIIVFDNIFVMLQGQHLAWCSNNFCFAQAEPWKQIWARTPRVQFLNVKVCQSCLGFKETWKRHSSSETVTVSLHNKQVGLKKKIRSLFEV